MKILILSHLFPNESNPALGSFVQQQVRFLRKHCQLKVIAPIAWFPPIRGFGRWSRIGRVCSRELIDGLEILHPRYLLFPRKIFFSLYWISYLVMLFWTVRNRDFDLIHAHTAYPDGLAALLFGKAVKKPVLITAHGSDINLYPEESRIGKILVCFALRHCDAVVAVSSDLKNRIEKLGVNRAKLRVIHNGIDIALFSPMDKENAVSQKGLSRQNKRILYTGGLLPVKGVGVLIEAMSILAISRNDIEMVLVGADKKGRTDREFIHMAKDLGLQEMVIFVTKVRNTEIPLWLTASDVFVLPSLSEGFGLSLVEALACGKPVVSTTCGGPEDIVTEEVGILVPPGDAKALASAIAYVLDHPEKYDSVRISSYARQRFNLEKISSQIFDLYRSLKESSNVKAHRPRTREPCS